MTREGGFGPLPFHRRPTDAEGIRGEADRGLPVCACRRALDEANEDRSLEWIPKELIRKELPSLLALASDAHRMPGLSSPERFGEAYAGT